MKQRYHTYRRCKGMFYLLDTQTGKRASLRTKDEAVATRICQARNEATLQPQINLQLARAYFSAADPQTNERTWDGVLNQILETKKGETLVRWRRAWKEKSFDHIRDMKLIQTRTEDFIKVLNRGGVSTNNFLRRMHNFALDVNWLLAPVLPKKQWPKVRYGIKRAITWDEHLKIVDRETNPERRAFYQLLWFFGGAQGDIAHLHAEDIDLENKLISFERLKNRYRKAAPPIISFGSAAEHVLNSLPKDGPLFPGLIDMTAGHRSTEFRRVCRRAGVSRDVTPHSYRYAWAERAKAAGMPERFAMQALGHNSPAVHRAYSRKALVKVPALEEYEKRAVLNKVIPMASVDQENIPAATNENSHAPQNQTGISRSQEGSPLLCA